MQRDFLWKQSIRREDSFVLGLVNKAKPQVKIRQRILNLAYQTYLESKQALLVVGSLDLASKHEGISVEINAVRGKPQPGVQADFMAQCRFCRLAEARDPNDTVLDLVDDVKTKQYSSREFSEKSLTDFFSLDIHGKLEGPNCSLDVSMVCFERRLNVQQIKEIPLASNSVYKMLQQNPKGLLWGWIHTSKGNFHLLVKDDLRQDCTGVWVSGCSSVHHPLVWLVCQHFLNSVDRSDIFALLHFDDTGSAHFYNVTPRDDVMRTAVFSGLEKTTVTRVFTARDKLVDVPLTLCYVDDGDFTMDVTRGTAVLDEVSKEVAQESYRLRTRSGIPQLLSPRPPDQYTPATIGVHKLIPKRITLSPISPPSSSSTPVDRGAKERRSHPAEASNPCDGSVSPEVMEIIKKQEMEISFLKEQIKILMSKQLEPQPPAARQQASGSPEIISIDPEEKEHSQLFSNDLSPPRSPEMNFAPMRPYVPETIIENSARRNAFAENGNREEPNEKYYSEVKRGILRVLSDNPRDVFDHSETENLFLPRLEDPLQKPTHNSSSADFEANGSMLQPRLRYQSLVLSGPNQPSLFVNEVTRKYFGKSPQLPTTNKILGKTSPQVGMLRRVLTAEASKQVFFAKPGEDDAQGTVKSPPQHNGRFLDVDALKKQPKLL